jgi:hypothetical protein
VGVETLGEAWNLSWTIHVRCLHDGREGMKHKRACGYRKYLDLETLVCTRGRGFPIATIRGLSKLAPRTLAIMHGPSFASDGAAALRALADDYDRRVSGQVSAVLQRAAA